MLELISSVLSSKHPWSAVFYLLAGAILGSVLSIYLTFKAQRPRLVVVGAGGGGNEKSSRWSISIANRPTFFGLLFAGETAREVHPWISLRGRDANFYPLCWSGQSNDRRATFDPGQSHSIEIFSWFAGTRGYCILDQAGEPVARFEGREQKFVLRLNDYLGRKTEFLLKVIYDDSHLKSAPRLQILHPLPFEVRRHKAMNALRQFVRAFR